MPEGSTIDAAEGGRLRRRLALEGLLIAALALTINLVGNGRIGLWDRDEPRYAVAVREMRARGDLITPSFNGEPRYHKPIFIYWVMGLGTSIFGDNPYGARFGSAIAGTLTCMLTWWLGVRMFGPGAGRLAALVLVTAPIMVVESKFATTDATLALFVMLAQACLWRLNQGPSKSAAMGFWAAMGLATLTKGPVGPALVAASGVASWWFRGSTDCWRRIEWRKGLLLFAGLTLPWFVAIGIASRGDFFRFAVGVQMIQRVTSKLEEHGGFPGFYAVTTLATFFPWSVLVPASLAAGWTRRRTSPDFGFLLGWVIGPLLVLEPSRTKLIHYFLPAIPALALLVGWLVEAVGRDAATLARWAGGRLALGLLGGLGIAAAAALAAGSFLVPEPLRWPMRANAVLLGGGVILTLRKFQTRSPVAAAYVLAGSWAAIALAFSGWLLPAAEPYRLSRVVGEKLAKHVAAEKARPILLTYQEPGIHYAMKLKSPTLRDWDEVRQSLETAAALVSPVTPEQYDGLCSDGRFDVALLEDVRGFNVSKARTQHLRLVRIRVSPAGLALRPVEQTKIK
ncbi:MAG TPA: glycosyltransferase family 39 protein [Isosphaeraceae bacterium]